MKIVIVGNSGSGKSTYAARLAERCGLARLELDMIVWEPHQVAVERAPEAVRADLHAFVQRHDRWVIEGCDGDLAKLALSHCSQLVFMNPGMQVCLENNRCRRWEPHKYDAPAEQERMLPHLLAWVESYYTRDDPRSYGYHRRLFEHHEGEKREILSLSDAA